MRHGRPVPELRHESRSDIPSFRRRSIRIVRQLCCGGADAIATAAIQRRSTARRASGTAPVAVAGSLSIEKCRARG